MISDQNLLLLAGLAVLLGMMLLFLWALIINQRAERRYNRIDRGELQDVINELLDRVMAKDYHDYAVGRHIQKPTDAAELEKILGTTDEDRREADGIPVN
jgi:cytidylate kinase